MSWNELHYLKAKRQNPNSGKQHQLVPERPKEFSFQWEDDRMEALESDEHQSVDTACDTPPCKIQQM